ncbi:MAG: hypothetical protein MUC48_05005 [Leptolyngbya sp. Prado105]|jgi:hypothetical protein|nr:hypothetical protein [Leptolyngbya sp. Prado105]
MYGYRGDRAIIRNFLTVLLVGYLIGQVLPLGVLLNALGQNVNNLTRPIQRSVRQ